MPRLKESIEQYVVLDQETIDTIVALGEGEEVVVLLATKDDELEAGPVLIADDDEGEPTDSRVMIAELAIEETTVDELNDDDLQELSGEVFHSNGRKMRGKALDEARDTARNTALNQLREQLGQPSVEDETADDTDLVGRDSNIQLLRFSKL